jgi:hypothetical protein
VIEGFCFSVEGQRNCGTGVFNRRITLPFR